MIIAIAGQKGGSGKTTLSCSLAVEAMRCKRSVLLVDADPQKTATEWVSDSEKRGNPFPALAHGNEFMHEPDQLPEIAAKYDLTIVDGPPRLYEVQRSIFMVSNLVIIPCAHAAQDFRALSNMFPDLAKARDIRPELKFYVVLNRVKTSIRGQEAFGALKQSGIDVLKTQIGDRLDFQDAYQAGLGVTTYSPTGKASIEIQSLYKEIMRKAQ